MGRKKVLIADDEEDIKLFTKLYLESRGYDVVTAFDGLDTVSAVELEHPDVILLDVMMPVLDGYEVAQRLRANERTAEIPIIMLSAAGQLDSIRRGMQAGAQHYVVKPFEPKELEQLISEVLLAQERKHPPKGCV
jgi:DNA-binding response OmpR family regulator